MAARTASTMNASETPLASDPDPTTIAVSIPSPTEPPAIWHM